MPTICSQCGKTAPKSGCANSALAPVKCPNTKPSKNPKTPAAVLAAEAKANEAMATLVAAREALKHAESAFNAASTAIREAREEADSTLPQCRMVRIGWWRGEESTVGRAVIIRKTPSGRLVVRLVGSTSERQFVPMKLSGRYIQIEKRRGFNGHDELCDVPPEYAHEVKQ